MDGIEGKIKAASFARGPDGKFVSKAVPQGETPSTIPTFTPDSTPAERIERCGADVSASPPVEQAEAPQEEKPRPWFRLVVLVWLLIMAAAFYFIYSRAFVVGSA